MSEQMSAVAPKDPFDEAAEAIRAAMPDTSSSRIPDTTIDATKLVDAFGAESAAIPVRGTNHPRYIAARAALLSRMETLERDSERLDWLDSQGENFRQVFEGAIRSTTHSWRGWEVTIVTDPEAAPDSLPSLRESIDAARASRTPTTTAEPDNG